MAKLAFVIVFVFLLFSGTFGGGDTYKKQPKVRVRAILQATYPTCISPEGGCQYDSECGYGCACIDQACSED